MADWTWTTLNADDAPHVYAIIAAIEEADASAIRTTRREVEGYFADSHAWRAQGAWEGQDLVAFGLARTPAGNAGESPITISGGVTPTWRDHGVGHDLLERQLLTARDLASELGLDETLVQMYVDASQGALFEMAIRFGFRSHSRYIQMRRSLDIPSQVSPTSSYIQIVKMGADWIRDSRKAHNRVMAENEGAAMSGKAWARRLESMDEDLCLVALDLFGDRPRLAGYVLASRFSSGLEDAQDADGVQDEGYIEEIVVLPEWRGKHVASNLLATAVERFRAAGLSYIGLDVTADGTDTDLVTVFEHFDFIRVAETYIMTTRV
ncbi:MAG: GNAT family N-acetyltransferase [Trueperella sp.]|uniref:GNAT family N-acetyltransferase n=1 Tax=Trueperella TaxID=1069494 RepID=UPI0025FC207B|nr:MULTISPECIES: GNAT family N-acetyltransferase [Trueperella]MCI7304661.1 GNAT family N-acetyltransferase [Trueperella sp.]